MMTKAHLGLDIDLSVSDALALLNQTLEFAYPTLTIVGELSDFKISKNRWLYFDLKDEDGVLRFFGTVYNLPGPLSDGMVLRVKGVPRIHPKFGFSVNILEIKAVGEGSIKKAHELAKAKLTAEGLFEESRKRPLPYPPENVGLITSLGSAAHADFIKIIRARWPLLKVEDANVHVQGEQAVGDIAAAIKSFNEQAEPPEVLVLTRGGGSLEDLSAFNDERLVRAVASSRIPTLLAIGHETDQSLAELASDARASTPSNAAELLVPELRQVRAELTVKRKNLTASLSTQVAHEQSYLNNLVKELNNLLVRRFEQERQSLNQKRHLAELYNPRNVLKRGYALVRQNKRVIQSIKFIEPGESLNVELIDGNLDTTVHGINKS